MGRYLEVRTIGDVEQHLAAIRASAARAQSWIAAQAGDPLDLLRRMKFEPVGFHPIEDRPLNVIEQINQTWTYAVALSAARVLLELHPEMRVVILTGYSSIATAVEAIKRGATNYLCKPADADDVLTALLSEHADLTTLVPENPMSVDRLQWEHIQRVLAEHDGNISATARALGMHRRTLQRKLQKRPVRR